MNARTEGMAIDLGYGAGPKKNRGGRYLIIILSLLACTLMEYMTGYSVPVFAWFFLSVDTTTYFLNVIVGSFTSEIVLGLRATVQQLLDNREGGPLLIDTLGHWICLLMVAYGARKLQVINRMSEVFFTPPLGTQSQVTTSCHCLGAADSCWRLFNLFVEEPRAPLSPIKNKVCPDCSRAIYARSGYREADTYQSTL
jgi:hypothetical protein